jgi:hypothetical protein
MRRVQTNKANEEKGEGDDGEKRHAGIGSQGPVCLDRPVTLPGFS